MNKTLLIGLMLIFLSTGTMAEKFKMKFGKVDIKDLEMKTYAQDTSASAVILADIGNSYFIYDNGSEKGWTIQFERHIRIKILKKEGFDFGSVAIPLYHSNSDREEVLSLKARTYNLENGKITVHKMGKSAIFDEETNKNWSQKKFSLPNIKEGSIIEYKYTIKSDFYFNFQNWSFQSSVPTIRSEYSAVIPEFFHYNLTQVGYLPLDVNERGNRQEQFKINYKSLPQQGGAVAKGSYSIDSYSNTYHWVCKNVPALKREKKMLALSNYRSQMKFELATIQFKGGKTYNFTEDWETVNRKLATNFHYGNLLNTNGFIKDEIETLVSPLNTEEEKMQAVFHFIKSYMKWNGENRLFAKKSLRKAWNEKSGNSSDINLLLTLALKTAGLNADPIALSTRNHGIIHPSHASLDQLNYTIARVAINGKNYLLDATDPYCTINLLPMRCLNGKGRLISKNRTDWISLAPRAKESVSVLANLKLTAEGMLSGNIQNNYKGYAAYYQRKAFDKDNFQENLESNNPGWTIDEFEYKNLSPSGLPFRTSYNVEVEDQIRLEADRIYFNPIFIKNIEESPFKVETRNFPVDFGHAENFTYILSLELPEGYTVEEKPQPIRTNLSDNAGIFSYSTRLTGNKLQIVYKFALNKTQFVPEEYPYLQQFYNCVIEKQNQLIILKRIDV